MRCSAGKKEGNVLQEKGGSALPEGFAPGEGSPRASSHKGWNETIPGTSPETEKSA